MTEEKKWATEETAITVPMEGFYDIEAVDYPSGNVVRRTVGPCTEWQAKMRSLDALNEVVSLREQQADS